MSTPDDIPLGPVGRASLVEALSTARDLPVDALEEASRHPGRIAQAVLGAAGKAAEGQELDEREANLLFWGIHVLAFGRDERLFQPLLRIARRDEDAVAFLLGDAVPATLPRLAASTFDGDVDALEAAISDPAADEFVRWSLFGAYAYLVFVGRIPRERAHGFLVGFDRERPARSGDAAWTGWEQAIALLGFADLVPLVEAARSDARLLEDAEDPEWFALTLAEAEAKPEDAARFHDQEFGYVEDVVGELAAALDDPEGEDEMPEPTRNPHRDVGRNDPCPCGSGKKFKKCCLEAHDG
ncbi:DUF1186 domain-containing protein [Enterovirga rhinocerotis]|uniref:Uncharacterized protein DUF1186 n=1 Tax=Enterovirga rhinocerotis TaxID=1339210 RepID=A0A4R7CBL6_9HYPH|nr:DUF1186 domain-containing protein [Enterovirga rhinocerotis]TDR94835.1 uncharacterized protein DUF1186 [Enterovirga rhinocerotis]